MMNNNFPNNIRGVPQNSLRQSPVFQSSPNKSKFKSPEHEIYVMRVDPDQWKEMRRMNAMGHGGDHPEFESRCQEIGQEIVK